MIGNTRAGPAGAGLHGQYSEASMIVRTRTVCFGSRSDDHVGRDQNRPRRPDRGIVVPPEIRPTHRFPGRRLYSIRVTAGTGKAEPHVRLDVVARNTSAIGIHVGEDVLRSRVSLLRCQTVPPRGLLIVLRSTLAIVIHYADEELRIGGSLLHCQAVPPQGLLIVLRNTLAP